MILLITANRKPEEESVSLTLGMHFLRELKAYNPAVEVKVLDLFETDFPLPTREELSMWERQRPLTENEIGALENPHVATFKQAERIVFVTPLWNMSFPPQVKAYIDRIIVPGHTFEFGEQGIEGLMKDKEVLHIQSTGGIYSSGPLASFEHGDSYLRLMMKLIGISHYELVRVEGTSTYPDQIGERTEEAKKRLSEIANEWTDTE
ncbi:FMN-dependent NADH-azoreductase [Salisediminibacterium selenitireducens]|uniref:FMN dependent NADH:quinone oxidoreductase n=1 Tax=Bacillus selenitireducens (strain ATCC 700615 / DSM 15326 / MLS10) TaxID=439292 RepID=D6Y1H7_BACIE|nr:NAD(P)H-dependent oxidoreductase [Salisediminibacterium selenitireducens]ADI00764.1 NAD(P)H dehydrogenase (quinone) [[Bacillus] selenitireducens MLS10]